MKDCCFTHDEETIPSSWPPSTVCTAHMTLLFEALCYKCHFAKASLSWVPWGFEEEAGRTITWIHPEIDSDPTLSVPPPPTTPGVQPVSHGTPGFGPIYRDFYETVDALDMHFAFNKTKGGMPYVVWGLGSNPHGRRMGIRAESVVKWTERLEYDWEMGSDGNYRTIGRGGGIVRGIETSGYEALDTRVGVASNPLFESFNDELAGARRTRSVNHQNTTSRWRAFDDQVPFGTPTAPWHPSNQTEQSPIFPEDDEEDVEDIERATDPELYQRLENRLRELSDGASMITWAPRTFTREDGTRRSLKERLELQIICREAEATSREEESMRVRPVRTRRLSYPSHDESTSMAANTPWFNELVESPEKRKEFLSLIGSPVERNPTVKPQHTR
jgi:hypothetical protein